MRYEMTGRDAPLIVRIGILDTTEFDGLTPSERGHVERTCAELIARYGWEAVQRDRARHRADLTLAFGTPEAVLDQGARR